MIDHVGIYGSRVAEGLSASNVGLVYIFCSIHSRWCRIYITYIHIRHNPIQANHGYNNILLNGYTIHVLPCNWYIHIYTYTHTHIQAFICLYIHIYVIIFGLVMFLIISFSKHMPECDRRSLVLCYRVNIGLGNNLLPVITQHFVDMMPYITRP